MKKTSCGRIFFGAPAVLFGLIALMWQDLDTWQPCIQFGGCR